MKTIELEIIINASREQVWDAITNVTKYRQWSDAFHEGSYFEGGWNKGDAIRFLVVNKEGQKEGMVSEIAESKFPEYISIKHLGFTSNGIDDTTSEEVRKWTPSFENYTLEKIDTNKTKFKLYIDVDENFYEMFLDMWPKAMIKL